MPFKKLSEKLAQARYMDSDYLLKQRLFEALKQSVASPADPALLAEENAPALVDPDQQPDDELEDEGPLPPELAETADRLKAQLETLFPTKVRANSGFSAKLANTTEGEEAGLSDDMAHSGPSDTETELNTISLTDTDHDQTGGSMTDLTGYKDLSKAPLSYGDDAGEPVSTFTVPSREEQQQRAATATLSPSFGDIDGDVDTEFSGNVKTLIRLVNELPEDVTKQTGAQIIRLTMEAMGISMEDVLSEAQSAQSEMLDAVRANIKKIEEYKTVIRKLETDIKYYQGKANELSEIIDLFILSNSSASDD